MRAAFGESTITLSPKFVLPLDGPLPVATSRLPVAGSTTAPERAQIAESLALQLDGWMIACRSAQSEFHTWTTCPFVRLTRVDRAAVGIGDRCHVGDLRRARVRAVGPRDEAPENLPGLRVDRLGT